MSNIKTIMESWRRYKKSLLKEQDMSSYEPAMSLPEEEEEQTMSLPPEQPPMDASTTPMTDIAMAASGGPTVAAANIGSSFGEIPTQAEFDDANSSTPVTDAAMRKTGGPTIDAADAGSAAGEIPTQAEFDKSQVSSRRMQVKARKQRRFFKNLAPVKKMLAKVGFPAGSGSGYTPAFANAVYRYQKVAFPGVPDEHDAIVGPKTMRFLKMDVEDGGRTDGYEARFGELPGRERKPRKFKDVDRDEKGRPVGDDGKPARTGLGSPIDRPLQETKKKSPHNDIKLISENWSKFLTERDTSKEEEEAGMSLPDQMSMPADPNAPNMSMPKPTIMDKVKAAGQKAVDDFNTPMSGDDNQQALAKLPLAGDLAAQQYGKAKAAAHASGLAGPKTDPQPPKPGPGPKPKPVKKGLSGWRAAKATQLRVLRKTFKGKQNVASVQQALVKAGKKYEDILSGNGKGKAADGDYGRRTYNAIAAFQKDYIAKNGKGSLGSYGRGGVDGVVGGRTLEALVKAAPETKLAKAHTSAPGGVSVKGKESDIKATDKLAKAKGKKAKTAAATSAASKSDAIEKAAGSAVVRQGKAAKAIFAKSGLKYPEIPGSPGAARTADVEKAADAAVKSGKMSKDARKELDTVIKGAGAAEALEKQQSGVRVEQFKKLLKKTIGEVEEGSEQEKRLKKALARAKSYSRLRGMKTLAQMAKATALWVQGKADDPIQASLVNKGLKVASFKPMADKLFDAMDGAGTDEDAIYKVLRRAGGPGKVRTSKGEIISKGEALRRAFGRRGSDRYTLVQMLADELSFEEYTKATNSLDLGLSPRQLIKIFRSINK